MEPRVEATSVGGYYASFEVRREPTDLTRTRKFKPKPDLVTTKYVRPEAEDDRTVPFIKESSPYELLDLQQEADAPISDLLDLTDVVEQVDMEELALPDPADCSDAVPPIDPRESIAMANLVRDESPPDVIVRFQRSSTYITRPRVPWAVISAMLVAAVGLGMGVAFLAF